MNAWTRLMVIVMLAAGCGDDDGPAAADAGADAGGEADAGLDATAATPNGTWRLKSVTTFDGVNAIKINAIDTPVAAGDARVNGTLTLDEASGEGGGVFTSMLDDHALEGGGSAAAFSWNTDFTMLTLGGDVLKTTWTPGANETLVIGELPEPVYEFERYTPVDTQTQTAAGNVTIEPPAGTFVPLVQPRVALINLLRGATAGELDYVQVPTMPPQMPLDVAMPVGFGDDAADTTTYASARSEGALGLERISYGAAGLVAVMTLCAYEDRDGSGSLSRFVVDDCASPTVDCIRGFSNVFLAYRVGASAELLASPYDLLYSGWQHAVISEDQRTDGTTLLPLDATTEAVPLDVQFAADPATVELPNLAF